VDDIQWVEDAAGVDWNELSELYRIAPLGIKPPDALATVFSNSMFACFAFRRGRLIGAGRAIADGFDCAYLADVAVHPDHQGRGLGRAIVRRLIAMAAGHSKIILYANPGTEDFYLRLGFPAHEHGDGHLGGPGPGHRDRACRRPGRAGVTRYRFR
jgi:GNAT superfamily N-acetyltransferase